MENRGINRGILDNDYLSNEQLAINSTIRDYLQTTAKWGKFLGIIGFILTGIMVISTVVIMGIGTAETMNAVFPMGASFIFLIYLLLAGLYFFPSLFLYRFSNSTQRSLQNNQQMDFENAFQNLKYLYQFFGITTVVVIVIYILVFLFAALA